MRFEDFIAELEAEALAEGPDAVAELEAFRAHFAEVRTAHLLHRLERVVRSTYENANRRPHRVPASREP